MLKEEFQCYNYRLACELINPRKYKLYGFIKKSYNWPNYLEKGFKNPLNTIANP